MTSPVDPNYPQRLKTAAQAVGTDNPTIAHMLATSGLTSAQIQAVGGFSTALQTNTTGQLVADSGITPSYTTAEQNNFDALGQTPPGQRANPPDTRNWFEKAVDAVGSALSDGGNFIFHNPVTHGLLTGLDWLNNAAHMPWRLVSEAVGGHDTQAENAGMRAQGYDPNSGLSKFWFLWNHGQSEYHDLGNVRAQYTDKLVDLAVQQQADPEAFQQQFEGMDPTKAADLNKTLNSQEYKQAFAAVDALHISPGRDIANMVFAPFHANTEDNEAFKLLSGTLDGVYTWMADPTLILGKVKVGMQAADALGRVAEDANLTTKILTRIAGNNPGGFVASRARGIQHVIDQPGIYKVMGVSEDGSKVVEDTAVGKAWDSFIDKATQLRQAQKRADDVSLSTAERQAAQVQAAQVYTQLDTLHRQLMPLLPEVNGTRVLAPKKLEFDTEGVLRIEHDKQYADLVNGYRSAQKEYNLLSDAAAEHRANVDQLLRRGQQAQRSGRDLTPAEVDEISDAVYQGNEIADKHGAAFDKMSEARDSLMDYQRNNIERVTDLPGNFDETVTSRLSGGWEAMHGDPITDRAEMARYLVSTGGLLRLANGEPATATMLMPGKISWWGERMAARKANKAEKWIDYVSGWNKLMPTDAENPALTALDEAGGDLTERARLGDIQHNLLRSGTADGQGFNWFRRARVRAERVNRRLSTTLPDIRHFDLTDASTLKDVERYARFYLNKGDSRLLAARYATGDLATRRSVVRGMLTQTFHAAGLYRTPAGKKFADEYLRDIDQQVYGLEGTDLTATDRGMVHAAIYNSQLSTRVPMPPLKQLNQLAVRFAVDSWASKMGLTAAMGAIQSNRMDALYGAVKIGWITSAASGFRNALDEFAGFMAKGMGRQWIQGRVAYTQATKDARAERRDYSRQYLKLKDEYGKDYADDFVGEKSGQAEHDLEKAQRDYENAQRAEVARAKVASGALGRDMSEQQAELEELIAKRGWLPLDEARANLTAAQQAAKDAHGLENAIHYRIPYIARRVGDSINDVLVGSALGKLLSVHPKWKVTPERIEILKELQNEELRSILRDGVQQTHFADTYGAIAGEDGAMYMARNGVMGRRYAYRHTGWGQVEPDGGKGADDFAKYLQLRFADPTEASHEWLRAIARPRPVFGEEEHLAPLPMRPHWVPEGTDVQTTVHWDDIPGMGSGFWEDLRGGRPGTEEAAQGIPDNVLAEYRRIMHRGDQYEASDHPDVAEVLDEDGNPTGHYTMPAEFMDRFQSVRREIVWHHVRDLLARGHMLRVRVEDSGAPGGIAWMNVNSRHEFDDLWNRWMETDQPRADDLMDVHAGWQHMVERSEHAPEALQYSAHQQFWEKVKREGLEGVNEDKIQQLRDHAEAGRQFEQEANLDPETYGRDSEAWLDRMHEIQSSIIRQHVRTRMARGDRVAFNFNDEGGDELDYLSHSDLTSGEINNETMSEPWRFMFQQNLAKPGQLDEEALNEAWRQVRNWLDEPEMRHFLGNAEMTHWLNGKRVTTPEQLSQAKDELTDRISADLTHGLKSRAGNYIHPELLKQLAEARTLGVPDRSWLVNTIPVDERPEWTVGELWAPFNPQHAPDTHPRGYMAMMGKAYEKVVTDQINALSRNPLMSALYVNAREHIAPWEQHLVDAGWDEDSAKQVAMRMSLMHAEQEAYRHIDNPWVSSQFSLVSRNFANFERAQEDWLRRWGRALKDNPAIIRKGQLALHAGTASGMLDQDPQTGELNFIYPGSQLAMRVFNSAMSGLGIGNAVKIPIVQELTSQVTFLSPSLQQPFGLTASPLLVLPMKAIQGTIGQDHELLMNSIDRAMNGQLGSGRSWYEQVLPPSINRIIRGVVMSDPGSQYGQAYTNATMALAASGHFDGLDGRNPTAISNAQDKIAVQTRNNMVLNTLFGFFAPATPTAEFNTDSANTGDHQGNTPDWTAHILGYRSLKAEAQKALADLGPTRFRLWWAAVHPNELIYDPTAGVGSHTKAGATNAYLPSTLQAAKWAEDNPTFRGKYGGAGGVAAYFVPSYQNIIGYDSSGQPIVGPSDPSQQFNEMAYRTQLQDHMRELKPLNGLLPDIIVQRGEREYYAAKDQIDAQIQDAENSGNTYLAKQLEDQWTQTKADIYKRNPLLAQKNASYATNGSEQQVALGQLRKLVDDNSASTTKAIGNLRGGVQFLLQAFDEYQTGDQALAGRRGSAATAARAQLLANYQAEIQSVAQQYPDLADLARGVFRTP